MNEALYRAAIREALFHEINRLKSCIAENGLIEGMLIQVNLLSNIKANVHSQANGFVPQNNNSLFDEVVETLVRERLLSMRDDGSLLVI